MIKPLNIVHCFRSPVGGIFRHVRDLIDEQTAAGHHVGILCDNNTGGAYEEELFDTVRPELALGLHRISMKRSIGPSDILGAINSYREIKELEPDVLHAHGAKGGAYARLIGAALKRKRPGLARLYCPHGGSMHYDADTLAGKIYFSMERVLERFTDRLIFVSEYERTGYRDKVGEPSCPSSLIFNGLRPEEFDPVTPMAGAADFAFIGMMRDLKGGDLFLRTLPEVAKNTGRPITGLMIGDGPDRKNYLNLSHSLGLDDIVTFHNPMPVREAFALAKCIVVPSRAESMPYIILETLAAQRPLIATHAGGIPEIFGVYANTLVEPDSLDALITAMTAEMAGIRSAPDPAIWAGDLKLRFSANAMSKAMLRAYEKTLVGQRSGSNRVETIIGMENEPRRLSTDAPPLAPSIKNVADQSNDDDRAGEPVLPNNSIF